MTCKVLLWDNNGTISSGKDPNDSGWKIYPNVKKFMTQADYNIIISGCRTPDSEKQDFDPEKVVAQFSELMAELPIRAALFSPFIGGVGCFILLKEENGGMKLIKAHEDPRYRDFIGKFKKPDIGMFKVAEDLIRTEFHISISPDNCCMIGDTWHDEQAAEDFGVSFKEAHKVHASEKAL